MKKGLFFWLFYILLFGMQHSFAQSIRINEVMASNAQVIADEDGDYSDWIELYNSGTSAIDLTGYGLTDNANQLFKWKLPSLTIQSKEFLLIWASGKDRHNLTALHTNFSISAAGESIILTHPDGSNIDAFPKTNIPTDLSYGRKPDGSEKFSYFTIATPGISNASEGYDQLLNPPQFSHQGGFYSAPFSLTLTSSEPSASIIYTIDGSDPDPTNLSGTTYFYKNQYPKAPSDPYGELLNNSFKSYTYNSSIEIRDRSDEEDDLTGISTTFDRNPAYFPKNPVQKGWVIKARAVKEGALPSEVITQSYFLFAPSRYTFPVISLSIQEDALFDYYKGIYVAGEHFDNWRSTNSTKVADGGVPANYGRSGDEWEYPAHVEMFDGLNGRVISQGVGIRIHGGWSRSEPQKSIRLYAKNQRGASHFEYPIFPGRTQTNFKRLLLRNSGNDWRSTMLRDALFQSILGDMDFESMAFHPSVLFINGEYWGIHNIRERLDKYYFETLYGVDPENLDILEGNWGIDEGDDIHYNETLDYIRKNGLVEDQHYEYINTRIDVNSFLDYQIAQIFIVNQDWPGNNIRMWRLRTDEYDPSAPKGHDGRWRWMLYDTDYGFGLYNPTSFNINMLKFATETRSPDWPNPPWSTFLLREFLKNENFRNDFINRYSDQLNTAFSPEVVKAKINHFKNLFEPEIEEHIARWNYPFDKNTWDGRMRGFLNFADQRVVFSRMHLQEFFSLGNEYTLEVDVSDPTLGYVKLNSLDLKPNAPGIKDEVFPWKGKYFNGVPIQLEAVPAPGCVFKRWEGADASTINIITLNPDADVAIKAIFERTTPVTEVPTGEENILHYWNFNKEDALLVPSFTVNSATMNIEPNGVAAADFNVDTGEGFSGENALFNDEPGTHLKVNNPLRTELILSVPTTGYEEVKLKFEARRSESGPEVVIVEYSLNGITFIEYRRFSLHDDVPKLYVVDFSDLTSINGKEHLKIRIRYEQGAGGTTGNVRLDNLSLEGNPGITTGPVNPTDPGGPVLSVEEKFEKETNVLLFPNPLKDKTTLRINAIGENSVTLFVQDLNGKVHIKESKYHLVTGENNISLDLHFLSKGVYMINCQFKNHSKIVKLIKI